MRKQLCYILFILLSFGILSCNYVSPEKTFKVCGLSLNRIPSEFSKHFKEIRSQHKNGSLTYVTSDNQIKKGVTAVEYVENVYPNLLKKDIEKIKNLTVNNETKAFQEATLDVFTYTQEVYQTDMIRIAKMIDEGKSDAEIDAAIEELQNTKGNHIDKKYFKAYDLVFPYADKHGIEYKTLNLY